MDKLCALMMPLGRFLLCAIEHRAAALDERSLSYQLLNGRQDAEEAAIIGKAGQRASVTIATNLAGRGTDIRLGETVADIGGLHVIVAERHDSSRVDRQLIGRAARQGNPGSACVYASADDRLIRDHGPWLVSVMQRHQASNGQISLDVTRSIDRIQRRVERASFASRCRLLRYDMHRESVLSKLSGVA